jgi:polyisoprenyl-teichoic acid--peptidoglycan teichoic acid transferase
MQLRAAAARRRTLTWILAGIAVLLLLGGLAFYRPFEANSPAGPLAEPSTGVTPVTPPTPLPEHVERTTFLVMGVDKRPDDWGRADTMMVVAFDPGQQQLSALSLPRDLWTAIPGHGYDKLNHSYAFGGEKLALATVQALLDIPIDHYVTLSFQDFAKIVDAVGGIEVDAEKRMEYEDPSDTSMGPGGLVIDIQPGLQHMDGQTALKYARFRMDEEGDMGRVRRQQQVAKDLLKAAARPGVVTRVPQLVSALGAAIDTDLSVADMLRLGVGGREAITKPLRTGVFTGVDRALGGIFYLTPDLQEQRAAAYELLLGSEPPAAYLSKAKQDQEAYARVLAEAIEHDRQVAEALAREQAQQAESGDEGEAGGTDGSEEGESGEVAVAPPAPPPVVKPPAKNQPVTVAVIDASGAQVAADYVKKLRDAGFRVARVSKASASVKRTVVIDHAGQPDTQKRITSVLPTALVVARPDTKAEEALEIVLGQDLAPKR